MTAPKAKTMVALTAFACEVKGTAHIIREGDVVPANHPAIKGREQLFSAYDPSAPKAA